MDGEKINKQVDIVISLVKMFVILKMSLGSISFIRINMIKLNYLLLVYICS